MDMQKRKGLAERTIQDGFGSFLVCNNENNSDIECPFLQLALLEAYSGLGGFLGTRDSAIKQKQLSPWYKIAHIVLEQTINEEYIFRW